MKTMVELKERMSTLINNPAATQSYILDFLKESLDDNVEIVDPTNPFLFLMECGVTASSVGIEHSIVNLYKRYPSLALTMNDLYLHMSDEEYKDRFSLPAETQFQCMMAFDTLQQKSVQSDTGIYRYVSIPKDTRITAGEHVFSTSITTEIRLYPNETVKVIYDAFSNTDLAIRTNVIKSVKAKTSDGVERLFFDIAVRQIDKVTQTFTVTGSVATRETMGLPGEFYKAKAYYRDPTGVEEWVRFKTTHTEETFDIHTPTCVLKLQEDHLDIYIPPIYNTGLTSIGGEVMIVAYVCDGAINVDYSKYKFDDFITELRDLTFDLDESVRAFNETTHSIYSNKHVVGGRNALSFEDLKDRVISNNVGINDLPITPGGLTTIFENYGYDLIKHLDTMTGRTYIVTSHILDPEGLDFISNPGIGFIDIVDTVDNLKQYGTIFDNDESITILPCTLYEIDQFNTRIVNEPVIASYKESDKTVITEITNSTSLRYSPWFYVIRVDRDILTLVPYQLDVPEIEIVNFRDQNNSVQLFMNSDGIRIDYEEGNYRIITHIKDDASITSIDLNTVFGQLSFLLPGNVRVFIEHDKIYRTTDGIFVEFLLETTLDIDEDDNIKITNMVNSEGIPTASVLNLESSIDLVYGITTELELYATSKLENVVYYPTRTENRYPLTMETVYFKFGTNLTNLWRDIRPLNNDVIYERALADVPLRYADNVLDNSDGLPFTIGDNCNPILNYLHKRGDIVYADGEIVYEYKKGDVLRDGDGNPKIAGLLYRPHKINIMTLPSNFYFTNKEDNLTYLQTIFDHIVTKSAVEIIPLLDVMLEHTDLYYRPKDTLGYGQVNINRNDETWVSKELLLDIIIYVEDSVYNNIAARALIEETTTTVIDRLLERKVLNKADITSTLQESYDLGVVSVSIDMSRTDGLNESELVSMADDIDRFSIAKKTFVDNEGLLSIKDDINLTFVNFAIK